MTIKDIITKATWNEYGDMDVTNDCIDDMACAWCGNVLTEAGEEYFAEALSIEAMIDNVWGCPGIVALINHRDDYERAWKKVRNLFASMAGYCSESDYEVWFTEGE